MMKYRRAQSVARLACRVASDLGLHCLLIDPTIPSQGNETNTDVSESLTAFIDERTLQVDFVPHDWILPRCCFVVHHGGGAPINSVFRAGKPSVVCPIEHFSPDQQMWALQVQEQALGRAIFLGPGLPAEEIEAREDAYEKLSEAMIFCQNPKCLASCARLMAGIQARPEGSETALAFLSNLL